MRTHRWRGQRVSLAVGVAVLIGCSSPDARLARVYTDPQYAFRVAAPDSGWTITDATGIPQVLVILKSQSRTEGFIPNVTVSLEPLPYMMTTEEYGKRNVDGLSGQGYELLRRRPSVINGNRFSELECLSRDTNPPLRFRHLCLVKNRIGYVITCTSPENYHESIEPDFDSIVQSFRFVGG